MLKILQASLQQYVNQEFPEVQARFRKGRGTRDKIANICWIIEKARDFQKNIYFCFIDYANLYAGRESTVRTGHGTTDWFQIGKGVHQGCILSPWLFNLHAEYIMEMPGWMKHKLESRLLGEISITSDMQMTPPLW